VLVAISSWTRNKKKSHGGMTWSIYYQPYNNRDEVTAADQPNGGQRLGGEGGVNIGPMAGRTGVGMQVQCASLSCRVSPSPVEWRACSLTRPCLGCVLLYVRCACARRCWSVQMTRRVDSVFVVEGLPPNGSAALSGQVCVCMLLYVCQDVCVLAAQEGGPHTYSLWHCYNVQVEIGDIVCCIDGEPLDGRSMEFAASLITGPVGDFDVCAVQWNSCCPLRVVSAARASERASEGGREGGSEGGRRRQREREIRTHTHTHINSYNTYVHTYTNTHTNIQTHIHTRMAWIQARKST